jgi:hypothetical protein
MRRALAAVAVAFLLAGCGPAPRNPAPPGTTATGEPVGNAPKDTAPSTTTGDSDVNGPIEPSGCEIPTPRPNEEAVTVELAEWTIKPTPSTVQAGRVAFAVQNTGTKPHAFLVIRAASPSSLPRTSSGAVAESRIDRTDLIGKVGAVQPGEVCQATFTVPAASYVLVDNLVAEPDGSHYAKGMVTTFSAG